MLRSKQKTINFENWTKEQRIEFLMSHAKANIEIVGDSEHVDFKGIENPKTARDSQKLHVKIKYYDTKETINIEKEIHNRLMELPHKTKNPNTSDLDFILQQKRCIHMFYHTTEIIHDINPKAPIIRFIKVGEKTEKSQRWLIIIRLEWI